MIIAATAVAVCLSINEEANLARRILEAAKVPAVRAFQVSELQDKITVAPSPWTADRGTVMRLLFDQITKGESDDQTKVERVAAWVQSYFVHPMHTPLRPNGQGVYDPIQLLKLRRAQCGQVNRVTLDILAAGGYRGRIVQLKAHHGAEVFFDDEWHYIESDALTDGDQIRDANGHLPSAIVIHEQPDLLDGKCLACESIKLAESASNVDDAIYRDKRAFFTDGGAWRQVFSVRPIYYEKTAKKTTDPEYGWMTYATIRE
jgi:hypothetical protein